MAKDLKWDNLYEFVKLEILQYKDKKMPQYMVLRLLGLRDGKFLCNKNTKTQGKYDFDIILLTFKLMKGTILNALSSTEIKDERHRVNLIIKIVESELNNVKDRIESKKKSEEKIESIDLTHQTHEQSNYKKKTDKKENGKLKNLW